jgi:tetratricopeptide (TPR) repeat protein
MACARLGDVLANFMGNLTAGRAMYARGARLLEGAEPCIEQGWLAIAAMGCDVGDPADLLARAELALDRARQFGDVNLETKALADAGLAHVQAGRVAEGMALLDEAMALACGPADDLGTCGKSVCSFFTACYYAGDFSRAGSWTEPLRRRGLIGGAIVILSNHCDAVQAALLMELGRWTEAEALLTRAMAEFEAAMRAPSWHPAIVLADLRMRQGRLAEAEELLVGKEQAFEALLPAARLHLERGDLELARATATRGLRALGGDRLRAIELLVVLVATEVARGDIDAATAACDELQRRVEALDIPALRARAAAARARVAAALGDDAAALRMLEDAIDVVDPRELPWLRVTLLLQAAALRERTGDHAGAVVDARSATAALGALDATLRPEDAALVARLVGPTGSQRDRRTAVLAGEGRWWTATDAGTAVRLRDTKGLAYLAALVAAPGVERHALDLVDAVEGVDPGGVDRRSLGDAGAVLDGPARAAYRRRIEELRSACDDELAAGRLERAEALEEELQQLVEQLAGAFGLGGRDRRAASAAERARLNVTRALRAALLRLQEALPEAGAALDRRVRTGLYCAYEPEDGDEIRWIVQSALNGDRRG